jgi:hypothetical protein
MVQTLPSIVSMLVPFDQTRISVLTKKDVVVGAGPAGITLSVLSHSCVIRT